MPSEGQTPPTALHVSNVSNDTLHGLSVFLTRWEMNDLLFMILEENIRPEGAIAGQPPLWFALTPNSFRKDVIAFAERRFKVTEERAPFLLTRGLTSLLFIGIVLWFCYHMLTRKDRCTVEVAFLTIAWFWVLSPTQNPWYWTWALPLVPFARNRLWLAMSGLTMIYYLRFWFLYHTPDPEATRAGYWGTSYHGVAFFDFVVVWLKFAPILTAILVVALSRHWCRGRQASSPISRC